MKTKDELIEWLRDAYAMEKAMELSLKKQSDSQGVSMLMREQAALHLAETQRHAEAVEACLKKLGSEVSTLKTAMAKGMEIMKGASTAFAGDHRVKDLLAMCAAEHFEIACYMALRAGAQRAGLFDVVDLCTKILKDEQRMAEWLEGNLPQVVMTYLDADENHSTTNDAEDDDMPETPASTPAAPGSTHHTEAENDNPPLTPTSFIDIHEGREITPLGGSQEEAVGHPPLATVDNQKAEFVLTPSMREPEQEPPSERAAGRPKKVA